MDLPMEKNAALFPGQWGIPGSDSPLGLRMEPTTVVRYVSSTHALASDLNDGTNPNFPKATLQGAITASAAGDWIILAQGHVSTVVAAGTITVNVANLTIIGLGQGARRPTFNFITAAGASILVTSPGLYLENVLCVGGINALTNPLHLQAADITLKNVEWRDSLVTVEAARAILTTAAADRLTIDGFVYAGFPGGDAVVNAFRLVGVDTGVIKNCQFYGICSTAWIEMITTLSANLIIKDCYFSCAGFGMTRNIVNTGPLACTGQVINCYDAVLSQVFNGGLVLALPLLSTMTAAIISLEKSDGACLAGQDNLFTITGGPIVVTEFYGICTAAPGGASQMHLDEAVVSPAADVPLSTDVAIDAIVEGGLITFSVAAPGVLTITAVGALEAVPAIRWALPQGTIKAHGGTARAACVIKWYMRYQPMSPLAVVTVAP